MYLSESSTKKENRYKWEKGTASSISHQSTEKEKKNRSKFVFHINLNRFQKDISDKKLSNKLDQKVSNIIFFVFFTFILKI